jgi:hypothetical protein
MFKNFFSAATKTAPAQSGDLKSLLENMIYALVDDASAVELTEVSSGGDHVAFELKVGKSDLGKVIGRHGRTASAMRTILSAASRKYKLNADLKIVE